MWDSSRFVIEHDEKTLRKFHENYKSMLHDESRRIADSSEARKYIRKNVETGDLIELLKVACRCIYDLTGDTVFRDSVIRILERRSDEGSTYHL